MGPVGGDRGIVGITEGHFKMCDIVHEDLTGLDVPFVQGQRAYSVPISSIEVSLKTRFAQPSFDPGIRG